MKNELNAIKYLSIHVSAWRSDGKIAKYEFSNDRFKSFINQDKLYNIIQKARLTESFWLLEQSIIEISAAFVIMVELNDNHKTINVEDVNLRVNMWKDQVGITIS